MHSRSIAALCAVAVSAVGTAALARAPVVRGGLGLAGFGDAYYSASDFTKRQVIWGAGRPNTLPLGAFYIPSNREPLGEPGKPETHDEAWYLANHPDWLVYKDDRTTLASSFPYGTAPKQYFLMPIDISNPAVRDYLWERRIVPAITRGFKAIAFDNVEVLNSSGRSGVKTSSGWKRIYDPAKSHDPAFTKSTRDFLRSMRARLNAEGLISMANISYGYGYEGEFLALARETDGTLVEGSFLARCRRNDPHVLDDMPTGGNGGDAWTRRFTTFRAIAEERGLIVAEICYGTSGSILSVPAEDVSWAIANYLLVRGERTYMMFIGIKEVQKAVDRPEFEKADRIGAPLGAPQKQGNLWIRRYEHGLVVVNPSARNAATFALGAVVYRDLANQTFTGTVSVSPATGLVLFNQARS